MSVALPPGWREPLLVSLVAGRRPGWVLVTLAGRALEWGGDLARYGLTALERGRFLARELDFLEGVFPLGREALALPFVQLREGRWVDAHVVVGDDDALVLLLDATPDVQRLSLLQQRGYDFALLVERAGARQASSSPPLGPSQLAAELDSAHLFAALLETLFACVFERVGPGSFRWIGRPADPAATWLADAFEEEDLRASSIHLAESVPFLENFLVDAEEHWRAGTPGALRSGAWVRVNGAGEEIPLEALAVSTEDGRALLLVQRTDEAFREKSALIQRARETSLEFERLRKEVERKEILLHCIVHDLKAPLSSMMGGLSLLKRPELAAERREEIIDLGLQQSRRQLELIRTILEVFAAEVDSLSTFQSTPDSAPSARASAARAAQDFALAYEERGVTLRLQLGAAADDLRVVGDEPRLVRVLKNLLENALRHAPRGSTVDLVLARVADRVEITVEDRGPGVPAAVRDVLFARFGAGRDGRVGSGLGLYFCRITLEQWGARIVHEEREGGGARFRLSLLAVAPASPP